MGGSAARLVLDSKLLAWDSHSQICRGSTCLAQREGGEVGGGARRAGAGQAARGQAVVLGGLAQRLARQLVRRKCKLLHLARGTPAPAHVVPCRPRACVSALVLAQVTTGNQSKPSAAHTHASCSHFLTHVIRVAQGTAPNSTHLSNHVTDGEPKTVSLFPLKQKMYPEPRRTWQQRLPALVQAARGERLVGKGHAAVLGKAVEQRLLAAWIPGGEHLLALRVVRRKCILALHTDSEES